MKKETQAGEKEGRKRTPAESKRKHDQRPECFHTEGHRERQGFLQEGKEEVSGKMPQSKQDQDTDTEDAIKNWQQILKQNSRDEER